jgi:hypothetical protein
MRPALDSPGAALPASGTTKPPPSPVVCELLVADAPGSLDLPVAWTSRDLTIGGAKERLEVRLIVWREGASTEIHDHPAYSTVLTSTCCVTVLRGELEERRYKVTSSGEETERRLLREGDRTWFNASDEPALHRVINKARGEMRTLHIYVPPIARERMRNYHEVNSADEIGQSSTHEKTEFSGRWTAAGDCPPRV